MSGYCKGIVSRVFCFYAMQLYSSSALVQLVQIPRVTNADALSWGLRRLKPTH